MKPPTIPASAIAYLRRQATAQMRDQVRIKRPSVPVYDATTGIATGSTETVGYTGVAHLHPAQGGAAVFQGDQLQAMVQIQCSIPWDASPVPHEEDHVEVVSSEDTAVVGRTLRIVDVSYTGTGYPVRVLTCTFVEASPFDSLA